MNERLSLRNDERPNRIYPERPEEASSSLREAVRILEQPPEYHLTPEQLSIIDSFDHALYDAVDPFNVDIESPGVESNLEQLDTIDTKATVLCLDYFLTEAGQAQLSEISQEQVHFQTLKEVRAYLATHMQGWTASRVKPIQTASNDWAKDQFTKMLLDESIQQKEPEYFGFLREPDKLVQKAIAAKELRRYYSSVRKHLREQADNATVEAQEVVLRLYEDKLKFVYAGIYQDTVKLLVQNEASGNDTYGELLHELEPLLPGFTHLGDPERRSNLSANKNQLGRFLSRLDKFLNGADQSQGSPISEGSANLINEFGTPNPKPRLEEHAYADLPTEALNEVFVDAEIMKTMAEIALAEYGLLSSDTEYDFDRLGRADDGKWQVIIDPAISAFEVDKKQGVVKVSKKYWKSIGAGAAGPLPVLDHEITHVIQHENASRLGLKIFQQIGPARANIWFEAGAMVNEIASRSRNFGIQYEGPNIGYLTAMTERLKGGSVLQCARASLNAYLHLNPDANRTIAAKQAYSRTLRVFRQGQGIVEHGSYVPDSSSLHYAEQYLMVKSMPEDFKKYLNVGRINIEILSQLHRVGLLERVNFSVPERTASEIVEDFVRGELVTGRTVAVKP